MHVLHSDGTILEVVRGGELRDGKLFVNGQEQCVHCDVAEIPDQDVSHLFVVEEKDGEPVRRIVGSYPGDLVTYDQGHLVDRDTGLAIDKEIHPLSPIEEQLGILRDQLVQILNSLGIEPTPGFARLNDVAIAAINDAVERKAVAPIA